MEEMADFPVGDAEDTLAGWKSSKTGVVIDRGYVVDDGIALVEEKIGEGGMGKIYRGMNEPYMIIRNRVLRGEIAPGSLGLTDMKQHEITTEGERRKVQEAAENMIKQRDEHFSNWVRRQEKRKGTTSFPVAEDTDVVKRVKKRNMLLRQAMERDFRSEDGAIAIKFLDPEYADRQNIKDRFQQEGRAMRKLKDSHLVRAIEYGFDRRSGMYYIVEEYVDNVMALEERADPLDPKAAMKILIGALKGLKYIHEHGMLHRDVKPSNIVVNEKTLFRELPKEDEGEETEFFIADDADIRLTDLGIAKDDSEEGGLTRTIDQKTVMGTPYYLAPEALEGVGNMDWYSDIWGMAGVGFKLLTGERPYEGSVETVMRQIVTRSPVNIRQTEGGRDVHPSFADAVERNFIRNPRFRLEAEEFLEDLEDLDAKGLYSAPSQEQQAGIDADNKTRRRRLRRSIRWKERFARWKGKAWMSHAKESSALVGLYDEMLDASPRGRENVLKRLEFLESAIRHCNYLGNETKSRRLSKDYAWEEHVRKEMKVDRIREAWRLGWLAKAAMVLAPIIPTSILGYLFVKGEMNKAEYMDMLKQAKSHLEQVAGEEDLDAAARMLELAEDTYESIPVKDYDIRFEVALREARKMHSDRAEAGKAAALLDEAMEDISEDRWMDANEKFDEARDMIAYLSRVEGIATGGLLAKKEVVWERLKARRDDLDELGNVERRFPDLQTDYRSLFDRIRDGDYPKESDIALLEEMIRKQLDWKLEDTNVIDPDKLGKDGRADWSNAVNRYRELRANAEALYREMSVSRYKGALGIQEDVRKSLAAFEKSFTFEMEKEAESRISAMREMMAMIDSSHLEEGKMSALDPDSLERGIETGKYDFARRLYAETESFILGDSLEMDCKKTADEINRRLGRLREVTESIETGKAAGLDLAPLSAGAIRERAGKRLLEIALKHYRAAEAMLTDIGRDYDGTVSSFRAELAGIAGYLEAVSTIGAGTDTSAVKMVGLRKALAEGQLGIVSGMYESLLSGLETIRDDPVPETREKELEEARERADDIKKKRAGIDSKWADLTGISVSEMDKGIEEAGKAVAEYRSLVKAAEDADPEKKEGRAAAVERLVRLHYTRGEMELVWKFHGLVPEAERTGMLKDFWAYREAKARVEDTSRYVRSLPNGSLVSLTDDDITGLVASVKGYLGGETGLDGLSPLLEAAGKKGLILGSIPEYIASVSSAQTQQEKAAAEKAVRELLPDLLRVVEEARGYPLGPTHTDLEGLKLAEDALRKYRTD